MEYVKLGRTGLEVSRICLGCMSYGVPDRGNHAWSINEEETRPFIKRALDGGIDGMESVLTCAKPVEHVVAGCVARVDGSALIPISAVDTNRIDHGRLLYSNPTGPTCIVYRVKEHDLHCDAGTRQTSRS